MKIRYKNSIVAFIDVLGFSNLVYSKNINRIEAYYTYILTDLKKLLDFRFGYTLISDSIVIYGTNTYHNLHKLLAVLSTIQLKLLTQKILVRGAISFGDLYVNKKSNIIVGAGLIKAYLLEKEAVHPRIIIDREIITLYHQGTGSFLTDFLNISFEKNHKQDDGFLWLDYGKYATRSYQFKEKNLDAIYTFIKENYYSNLHYTKFRWLRDVLLFWLKYQVNYYENLVNLSPKKQIDKNLASKYALLFSHL